MQLIRNAYKSFRGNKKTDENKPKAAEGQVNYAKVRQDIKEIMDDADFDDGSYGPLFIRLAWHSSGTFDKDSNTGGSNGATMRYEVEANDPENVGLERGRKLLEPIKEKHPNISYSDLWIIAAYVAIEVTGGPIIEFNEGRKDKSAEHAIQPGRLPEAEHGLGEGLDEEGRINGWENLAQHIRDVFGRMGFNDREIVALLAGGHVYGRCHPELTGYAGAWVEAPTVFSNEYAADLIEDEWMYVDENTRIDGELVPEETRPTNGKRQYMTKWEPTPAAELESSEMEKYPLGVYRAKGWMYLRRTHQTDSYVIHKYEKGDEINIISLRKVKHGLRGQVDSGGWVSIVDSTGQDVLMERIGDLDFALDGPTSFRVLGTTDISDVGVYEGVPESLDALKEAKPLNESIKVLPISELIPISENDALAVVGKISEGELKDAFVKIVDPIKGGLFEKIIKDFNETPMKPIKKANIKYQMMLPADMVMLWDPEFKKYLEIYADDEQGEDELKKDFGAAYKKLTELGVPGCPVAH